MVVRKVSKMGSRMRVIYLPTTDFTRGQMVRLRPKSKNYGMIWRTRKVSKMGRHLAVVIPKRDWSYFRHGWNIVISSM